MTRHDQPPITAAGCRRDADRAGDDRRRGELLVIIYEKIQTAAHLGLYEVTLGPGDLAPWPSGWRIRSIIAHLRSNRGGRFRASVQPADPTVGRDHTTLVVSW